MSVQLLDLQCWHGLTGEQLSTQATAACIKDTEDIRHDRLRKPLVTGLRVAAMACYGWSVGMLFFCTAESNVTAAVAFCPT